MDLLTKYRPVRSLEFYQRKALSFIYGPESSDDLRSLNIPYGNLGFETPFHFVRCIPPGLYNEYENDILFARSNKTLRKGNKVFITLKDGKVQSAVYKGQKTTGMGESEAILEGQKETFLMREVVPYKEYLRNNVGLMLEDGNNRVTGSIVQYVEPTWNAGQVIYYKPSKRWGVILERQVFSNGKIICIVKLEFTKLKREKVLRVPLSDLKVDGVPYRVPVIPKSSGKNKDKGQTNGGTKTQKKDVDSDFEDKVEVTEVKSTPRKESMDNSADDNKTPMKHSQPPNKDLTPRTSLEITNTNISAAKTKESRTMSTGSMPSHRTAKEESSVTPRRATTSSISEEHGIVDLAKSPRMSNDYTEAPTVQLRHKPSRTGMRPLTEFFHSKSVEVQEDYKSLETNNFRSVNNLTTHQSSSDDEDDSLGLETYTNSLRRSARNILARQVADQARLRSSMRKSTALSSDNLLSENIPKSQHNMSNGKSVNSLLIPTTTSSDRPSISANDASLSESESGISGGSSLRRTPKLPSSKPPALPTSLPPGSLPTQHQSYVSHQPYAYIEDPLPRQRALSAIERYFPASSDEERAPRNYENSNFQPNYYSRQTSYEPMPTTVTPKKQQQHRPVAPTTSAGSTSVSSEPSTSLHDGYSRYSLTDIPDFTATQDDEVYVHQHQQYHHQHQSSHHDYEDPQTMMYIREDGNHSHNMQQHPQERITSPQLSYASTPNLMSAVDVEEADFMTHQSQQLDVHKYPNYPPKEKHSSEPEGGEGSEGGSKGMSTIEKRFKKNKSLGKGKSVPNMEELQRKRDLILPQPFTSKNIHTAVGKGRGIQAGYNSCYADVSLLALFYCTNIFDKLLLQDSEGDKGMKKDIKAILRQKIVKPLRLSAFCSRESVSHLREAMLPLSSKLNGSFMDAEEFIQLLFENALNLPQFVHYSNNTSDFMHQIVIRPKDRSKCHDVQFLLETSLEINDLKMRDVPLPALMLCMPRCNGRLVYYDAIVPNLSLNITSMISKGPKKCLCEMAATLECALCYKQYGEVSLAYCQTCQRLSEQIHFHIGHNPVLIPKTQANVVVNLHAVICIRANTYTVYVKTGHERHAPWLFFEAVPTALPQVILLEDFGRWMDKLEREPERYRELAKMNPYLKRMITDCHICIYYAPEAVPSSSHSESFMI